MFAPLPLRRLCRHLASAGLLGTSLLASAWLATPALAQQTFGSTVQVVTDGDSNSPDDLSFLLTLAAGEQLTDISLLEDGKAASLAGHFSTTSLDANTLKLQLSPALDFDRFKDVKAALRIKLSTPETGASRDVVLPLLITAPATLAEAVQARLAVPAGASSYLPLLPLTAAGNLHLLSIARRQGTELSAFDYLVMADQNGVPIAAGQQAIPYIAGQSLSFDIDWSLLPGGRPVSQPLTLVALPVADLNQDLQASLTVAPGSETNALSFTAAGAVNLSIEDVLLPEQVPGQGPVSGGELFLRERNAEGDVGFTLKQGNILVGSDKIGSGLSLRVKKRLDGQSEVWQTVHVMIAAGTAAGSAASNVASTGAASSASANPTSISNTTASALAKSATNATSSSTVPKQASAEVNSQFGQLEATTKTNDKKRIPRTANSFAARYAVGPTTLYEYDANGNRTKITDPLGHVTINTYDGLSRLATSTDPANSKSTYAYNGQDRLTAVTLPRGLTTSYTYNGLGDQLADNSPDTGSTAKTYDVAGNLLTRTDAKGQTTTYTYDALSRVTSVTQQDGSRIAYSYDQGSNGQGRLTAIDEKAADGSVQRRIRYTYDSLGRILTDTRTVAGADYTTSYRYDLGRLAGITYPSGRRIDYSFNSAGQVSSVQLTDHGQSKVLAQNISYRPFGAPAAYTNGAGQALSRGYDSFGQVTAYDLGPQRWQLIYDAASRITTQADANNPTTAATYNYDVLDRLTGAVLPAGTQGYVYDVAGNRTSQTLPSETRTYSYASNSNRLQSVSGSTPKTYIYDANGSITGDGSKQFAYDTRGRLTQAILTSGTVRYEVNALGQRVRKQSGGGGSGANGSNDHLYHYDLAGRLIAESAADGSNPIDYVWLGDLPLAIIQ